MSHPQSQAQAQAPSSSRDPLGTRQRQASASAVTRKPLLPPAVSRAARASSLQGQRPTLASAPSPVQAVQGKAKGKSLFQSYTSLTANARIAFGVVLGLVAIGGMLVDRNVLQDEKQEDKGFSVHMVDRK